MFKKIKSIWRWRKEVRRLNSIAFGVGVELWIHDMEGSKPSERFEKANKRLTRKFLRMKRIEIQHKLRSKQGWDSI